MFELMDALDRVHLFPGQVLYCMNGDTVIIKEIVYDSMYIEYKGRMYIRKVSKSYNKTLFEAKKKKKKRYYNVFGYDDDGYDINGYNIEGFDREGYDREGYNRKGYTKEGYDRDGYDGRGFDREGFDREGFNKRGYDRDGFTRLGFDADGFDRQGFDYKGRDRSGFDREGFDEKGFTSDGRHWTDVAKHLTDGEEKTIHGTRCCNSGIIIRCKDCKTEFIFSFGEYDWFKRKGYNAPKRCSHCREIKKRDREKFDGLLEIMNTNGSRRITGRQMAYRQNTYIEE